MSVELGRFPQRTLKAGRPLYRIHRATRGPWWFSSDGSGRFDPIGSALGACYLAEKPLGAWIEVFRKQMVIAEEEIVQRRLLTAVLERDLRLADLTARRALGFGASASLAAGEDYLASQAFAAEAVVARFDGVRYLLRHDPAQHLYGVALFAPRGAPDDDDQRWPNDTIDAIPIDLLEQARHLFRYRVLPTP